LEDKEEEEEEEDDDDDDDDDRIYRCNFNAVCYSFSDISTSGLSAISGCLWLMKCLGTSSSLSMWSRIQVCCCNLDDIYHTFGYISIHNG